MLYKLVLNYVDIFSFLNVFKYLTVRTGLAMFTSMVIVFLIGTPFINFFSAKQITNPIREDGPDEHIIKKIGTPPIVGVPIFLIICSSGPSSLIGLIICRTEKKFINGVPITNTTSMDVNIASPVLTVKYLKTLRNEKIST